MTSFFFLRPDIHPYVHTVQLRQPRRLTTPSRRNKQLISVTATTLQTNPQLTLTISLSPSLPDTNTHQLLLLYHQSESFSLNYDACALLDYPD